MNKINKLGLLNSNSTAYFLQDNNKIIDNFSNKDAIVLPIDIAIKNYNLDDKLWSLVDPNQNQITRLIASQPNGGYFIEIKKDAKLSTPIKTCLLTTEDDFLQTNHNIIILNSGSKAEIIAGCISECNHNEHYSVTEIFIKDNCKVKMKMLHDWTDSSIVKPIMKVQIGNNSILEYEFICINPPKEYISNPIVDITGSNSKVIFKSQILANKYSNIDSGSVVNMLGNNSIAEIVSKNVSNAGKIINRGKIISHGENAGHIECDGLSINNGSVSSIPEISDVNGLSELTHEASIGKISQNALEYLMTRGLNIDQATQLIVSGFLQNK